MSGRLAVLLVLVAQAAGAVEYVETAGPLKDADFYRLVACGAPPGAPCAEEFVRWAAPKARDLAVTIAPLPADHPRRRAQTAGVALDAAIAEINGAGAALRLRRVETGLRADVRVYLTPARSGETIRGTGVPGVDGAPMQAGLTTIWWNDRREITDAVIVLAADLPAIEMMPVMLEELTQAMGLLTDIRNPHYDGLSVFSEDSNSVRRLGQQDRMALRRHYP